MAIKDLQARQGNVELTAEVIDISEPREFSKFGRTGKVANAKIKDETGTIKLTLWNEQADIIKKGDKVHITNGWVGEYQGELQLSTGKFGKLEILGKEENAEEEVEKKEVTEKEVEETEIGEKPDEEETKEEPEGAAEEEEPEEKKPQEPQNLEIDEETVM